MTRSISIGLAVMTLVACHSKPVSKQDELKKLRAQQQELNEKIAKLQAELQGGQPAALQKTFTVAVTTLQPVAFKSYVEVQGRVDAEQNVNATPEVPGIVRQIYVQVGQKVTAGQVLAQLDDDVQRQAIAQLQTQLDFAKSLYEKQKNLWEQNIGTEVQLLQARTNYESLQKNMAIQKAQLAKYRLSSPIRGTVDAVDIKIGQSLSPGIPAIRVVNTDLLKVKAQVGETYASRISQGDEAKLIFPDLHDTLQTRLSYVAKVIDPLSRSFNVEVKLPPSKNLRPNMLAVIQIVGYRNKNAIVVPVETIQKAGNGDFVMVAVGKKARKKRVTVGEIYDGKAEIKSGLQAGDQLITAGYADLDEGTPIQY